MCNIGIACLEELADFDDVIGSSKPKRAAPRKAAGKTEPKAPPTKTAAKKKAPTMAAQEPKAMPIQPKASAKEEPNTDAGDNGKSSQPKFSEAQKRAIYNLSRRRGISVEQLEQRVTDTYGCVLENLTSSDASAFIKQLQRAA
jgi:hypothetical protein